MTKVTTANYHELYDKLSPWEKTQVQPMPGGLSMVDYLSPSEECQSPASFFLIGEQVASLGGCVGMEPSDCSMYVPGCIPLWHWI